MVLSVVSSVLGKIAELTLNKAFELYGLSDQVELMRIELSLIEGFLKDVDYKPNKSNALISWMNELRGVANRINNVMDTFLIEIEKGKTKGCCTMRRLKFWKKPLQLNDLSSEIRRITLILKTLYERGTQLRITASDADTQDTAPVPLSLRPTKLSDIDDSEVVGLDSNKSQIIIHLLDTKISERTVLSIVGIGGLGKTTLAQKVYKSSELDGRFECRTWVSISQKFDKNNILREILYSIKPKMKKNPPLKDDDLLTKVKISLGDKRYLLILDDVWTPDLWNGLKTALPDANNASRVIITTRSLNVAMAADRNTKPYQLSLLKDDDSVALLFRKAFQRNNLCPENYPPPLKDVAGKLIKKCGGLPLAVVVLGGILSMKEETFAAWNRVYETMNWHDEDGEKCMNILAMSYEDLPHHLKPCFLYFASFPEDYNISAKFVTRMLVAEELIAHDGVGSLEDRAEDCLQELVQRCLVQVTDKSANGYCKNCRMHDLLRDLAIHKAKEINFFTVLSKEGDGSNQQPAPIVLEKRKEKNPASSSLACRVALQFCTPTDYGMHLTNIRSLYGMHLTNIRSLLFFGKDISNYENFRQLRVLVFERVNEMHLTDNNWLGGLVHLRYLGIRNSSDIELGIISFKSLKSLTTLDFMGTSLIGTSTPSLWEIPTLRHVIADYHSSLIHWPLNWAHLKNLQTLKWVLLGDTPTLECNVILRTLKITNYVISAKEGWQRIQALLSRTEHLVSLAINSHSHVPFLSVGTRGLPCHEKIQSLWLRGSWVRDVCVPSFKMFPKNLTKLKLIKSNLEKDPMPILERLQSLNILHLLEYSHLATKMTCSTDGFPSLQKLKVQLLPPLKEWKINVGAMPILTHLEIENCVSLYTLPELQNVPNLRELVVIDASRQLHESSKAEDRYKIEHIPSVRIKIKR